MSLAFVGSSSLEVFSSRAEKGSTRSKQTNDLIVGREKVYDGEQEARKPAGTEGKEQEDVGVNLNFAGLGNGRWRRKRRGLRPRSFLRRHFFPSL